MGIGYDRKAVGITKLSELTIDANANLAPSLADGGVNELVDTLDYRALMLASAIIGVEWNQATDTGRCIRGRSEKRRFSKYL
ncbi:unnamed protein product [marine sediment metagenome]|uniref:Uncharacterized protein n=1 Tax=marine sediment metagenome TaxID=412755 RepID=X1SS91_9ZZZZ